MLLRPVLPNFNPRPDFTQPQPARQCTEGTAQLQHNKCCCAPCYQTSTQDLTSHSLSPQDSALKEQHSVPEMATRPSQALSSSHQVGQFLGALGQRLSGSRQSGRAPCQPHNQVGSGIQVTHHYWHGNVAIKSGAKHVGQIESTHRQHSVLGSHVTSRTHAPMRLFQTSESVTQLHNLQHS